MKRKASIPDLWKRGCKAVIFTDEDLFLTEGYFEFGDTSALGISGYNVEANIGTDEEEVELPELLLP